MEKTVKLTLLALFGLAAVAASAAGQTSSQVSTHSTSTKCEEQLVFALDLISPLVAREGGFVVLAPKGSPYSVEQMKKLVRNESVKAGYQHQRGILPLEDFHMMDDEPQKHYQYRFTQMRPLADGQIQLAVYEGSLLSLKRIDRTVAKIVLSQGLNRVELHHRWTDDFFVRFNAAPLTP